MLLDLAVGSSGTITRPVDANTAFLSPLYFKLAEQQPITLNNIFYFVISLFSVINKLL